MRVPVKIYIWCKQDGSIFQQLRCGAINRGHADKSKRVTIMVRIISQKIICRNDNRLIFLYRVPLISGDHISGRHGRNILFNHLNSHTGC